MTAFVAVCTLYSISKSSHCTVVMDTGVAGSVQLTVGTGARDDGGDVIIGAGATTATRSKGGSVLISAGDGLSTSAGDGGRGGDIR